MTPNGDHALPHALYNASQPPVAPARHVVYYAPMTAVTFDTLKLARRLEGAGFTRAQADGAAEALADSLSNEMASKGDIAELRASISALDSKLSSQISALDTKLSSQIMVGDSKVSTEIASVRSEIAAVRSATAQWIITAVFINTAGLIGAIATVWQLARR